MNANPRSVAVSKPKATATNTDTSKLINTENASFTVSSTLTPSNPLRRPKKTANIGIMVLLGRFDLT